MHPERFDVLKGNLDEGFKKSGRSLADFDIAPTVLRANWKKASWFG